MKTKSSEIQNFKFNSPKSTKIPGPDPSDDPEFQLNHDLRESDRRFTATSDRHDLSTENSICLQNFSNMNSPKASSPEPDLKRPTREKLNKNFIKDYEKIEEIGESSVLKSSEFFRFELEDGNIKYNDESQQVISFEGPDDLRIPRLKWCAHCGGEVMTKALYVNNEKTFWSAVGIFLSGGVLGCFILPYMMDSCKGIKLQCYKCERMLS